MTALDDIRWALDRLRSDYPFLNTAAVAANLVDNPDPAEENYVLGMTTLRRAEFVAGRSAARQALHDAGRAGAPIPRDDDGVAIFPAGCIGSIAHKAERAIAAIAPASSVAGIGIDLEFDDGHDDAGLSGEVVGPNELHAIELLRFAEPTLRSPATLVLAMKEALYKAVYPILRVTFDFDDVELSVGSGRTFRAIRYPGDGSLAVKGRFEISDHWVVTLAIASIYV